MTKRLTAKEFIQKAILVHGTVYDYSKVLYKNNRTKVTITCPEHGDFEQIPNAHLNSQGCPKCSTNYKDTTDSFILKANNVHNNKYNYNKTIYIKSQKHVIITCKIHGDFSQRPNDHLMGNGCSKCAGKYSPTNEEFILAVNKVHDYKYCYDETKYISSFKNIIIKCPIHGAFEQEAKSHLSGKGCPSCSSNGFDSAKPGILYYLKINGGQLYKIGITNKSVNERFTNTELQLIEIIKTWYYLDGAEARAAEQKILKDYKQYQYTGLNILKSGNTELFTIDVLGLDT